MAFNVILVAVSVLMAALLLVWACCPRLRPWMEAPKYRVLTWQSRFPEAVREGDERRAESDL